MACNSSSAPYRESKKWNVRKFFISGSLKSWHPTVSLKSSSSKDKRMSTVSELNLSDVTSDQHSSASLMHAASMPALSCSNCIQNRQEIEKLQAEISTVKKELKSTQQALEKHQKSEKMLRERLATEAQRQMALSDKFEDVNLGSNRPTALIQQYGILYSQTRVDALDSLDSMPQLAQLDNLKSKLLFSVIVLSFRACQQKLQQLKDRVISLLSGKQGKQLSASSKAAAQELEENVVTYLRKTLDTFDINALTQEVQSQIYATLYDYPCLKQCSKLRIYINECVRIAWKLFVQNPPCTLEFDCRQFNAARHTRFHTSNGESTHIQSYMWPALLDGKSGACLHRGVVRT